MVSRSFVEVSALFVAAALACTAPLAGAGQQPLTRAQVAAETLAAAKAHQLQPAGEGSPRFEQPAWAEVNAETRAAAKAGQLTPAGEGSAQSR